MYIYIYIIYVFVEVQSSKVRPSFDFDLVDFSDRHALCVWDERRNSRVLGELKSMGYGMGILDMVQPKWRHQ